MFKVLEPSNRNMSMPLSKGRPFPYEKCVKGDNEAQAIVTEFHSKIKEKHQLKAHL